MVKIAAVIDSACLIGLGVIPVIRPLLDALDANQFHIGEALRAEALRLAGE